ncbi:hypothetical protein D1B31_15200 [Neobacillus notoginsengisoli]|uniref:DUF3139 domain-containing protein n=1 Tax=Neobacillus notoginsengisoli TaxID=1578198 RepID=A0A417YS55_9BACI|nr:hypothetical protein [Neobacillus notoginsengisoli]RHW38121.1 hypothetical protein D1B31_15200 [Neobacillus notoginsengisoli]
MILFSLYGFSYCFFYGTPWDKISYNSKFETYLENKYNQVFVIKEISYDLLHGRTDHANAFSEKFIPEENQEDRSGFSYSIALYQDEKITSSFSENEVNDNYNYAEPDIYRIVDHFYESPEVQEE